ncbi:MAG TPA: DUF624 domain-containing protein [Devosiaceae bacterium]|jgi:hypothetical protein|nr:DUF624 domain-containing protein [Devosiaceae bacterium]
MNWLAQMWTREGPGIPRDAPPKEGLALLVDVVARNWWELIQLNLLIILFGLPLVTLPAALVAAGRICALMLEDRPLYLGRDFLAAFRAKFWPASAAGALGFGAFALAAYAAFVFLQAARANLFLAMPLALSAATAVFALLATAYAFTLLAMRDQQLSLLLRRALLGALARPLPVLVAFGFVALLWLLHILFYPASIFMPAVVNFSFGALVVTFGAHRAAARLLSPDKGAGHGAACAGGSA